MESSGHEDRTERVLTEDTPLLGAQSVPINHLSRRFTPETLIIPIALGYRLAATLPATTTLEIVKLVVCRQYYLAHDPTRIPPAGPMPTQLCMKPAVNYTRYKSSF
jgi:hypothetical protein